MVKVVEGNFASNSGHYAIVISRFNSFICESLLTGALDALKRHGIDESQITVYRAPGAFELPVIAQKVAKLDTVDAVIALGAVIRGGTPHFDYVAGECAKGLGQVALASEKTVVFGVLTVDTIEQAIERAGTKAGNKGAEAAMSAIEMVNLLNTI